jgi:hypothetical protein
MRARRTARERIDGRAAVSRSTSDATHTGSSARDQFVDALARLR